MKEGTEEHAIKIAEAAHFGQFDKGCTPRVCHVIHVGNQFPKRSPERIVGYLHDVLEDSPLISETGLFIVFGGKISEAVFAITRQKDEVYFDYIRRCRLNRLARVVKMEDIKHNLDRARWPDMPDSYLQRENKALWLLDEFRDSEEPKK